MADEARRPVPITALSQLEVGKDYMMMADETNCSIRVITPGASPLCVLYGDFRHDGLTSPSINPAPMVVQLVGWMAFTPSQGRAEHPLRLSESFISFDQKPEGGAYLVAAWITPGMDYHVELIACEPRITEM